VGLWQPLGEFAGYAVDVPQERTGRGGMSNLLSVPLAFSGMVFVSPQYHCASHRGMSVTTARGLPADEGLRSPRTLVAGIVQQPNASGK
jgi:hypothetical protein